MRRHELTDEQWALVERHVPRSRARTGRPPSDPRPMLNGIFRVLHTGAPWRDLPERFGPWQTVYDHFSKWRKGGVFARVVEALQLKLDNAGLIDWTCGAWTGPTSTPAGRPPVPAKKSPAAPRRARGPRAGPRPRRVWIEVPPGH
jgi:transposase